MNDGRYPRVPYYRSRIFLPASTLSPAHNMGDHNDSSQGFNPVRGSVLWDTESSHNFGIPQWPPPETIESDEDDTIAIRVDPPSSTNSESSERREVEDPEDDDQPFNAQTPDGSDRENFQSRSRSGSPATLHFSHPFDDFDPAESTSSGDKDEDADATASPGSPSSPLTDQQQQPAASFPAADQRPGPTEPYFPGLWDSPVHVSDNAQDDDEHAGYSRQDPHWIEAEMPSHSSPAGSPGKYQRMPERGHLNGSLIPPNAGLSPASAASTLGPLSQPATPRGVAHPLQSQRPGTPGSSRTNQSGPSEYDLYGRGELLDMKPEQPGLSRTGTFWEVCHEHQRILDRQTIQEWQEELDNLTIITGLFSATVTAFLVVDANPDPSDSMAQLLVRYIDYTSRHPSNPVLSSNDQDSLYSFFSDQPPVSNLRIATVTLWSLSVLVLFIALIFAFYIKSWLQYYQKDMRTGSNYDRAHLRQLRSDDFQAWNVPALISAVPFLVHLAALLFIVGIILKLFAFHVLPAIIGTVVSGFAGVVYMGMTIWPLFRDDCPYHNSMIRLFVAAAASGRRAVAISIASGSRKLERIWVVASKAFQRRTPSRTRSRGKDVSDEKVLPVSMPARLSWSTSLPAVPAFQRNLRLAREKKRMGAKMDSLDWHAVTWMLDRSPHSIVCQQAFSHLRYVPGKVVHILDTSIPTGLMTKFQMPVLDEGFWTRPPPALTGWSTLRMYFGYAHDALLAYNRLWEFLALDDCTQAPAGVDSYKPTTERLNPDLMRVWELLDPSSWPPSTENARTETPYQRLSKIGWADPEVEECFAAALAIEAIRYHLRLAPLHGLRDTEIHEGSPLFDLLKWIQQRVGIFSQPPAKGATKPEDEITFSFPALASALSGVAHCLLRTDLEVVRAHRGFLLGCLLDLLVGIRSRHTVIIPALTACFVMFASEDRTVRREALIYAANFHMTHSSRESFAREYQRLAQSLGDLVACYYLRRHLENANNIALALFRSYIGTLSRTRLPSVELFREIPDACVDFIICETRPIPHHHIPLSYFLVSGWYEREHMTTNARQKAIAVLHRILTLPNQLRPHGLALNTLLLFKRLLAGHIEWQTFAICQLLARALYSNLQKGDKATIADFVYFDLHCDFAEILKDSRYSPIKSDWMRFLEAWREDLVIPGRLGRDGLAAAEQAWSLLHGATYGRAII